MKRRNILDFAVGKLLGGSSDYSHLDEERKMLASLAVFGCRAALHFSPKVTDMSV